MIIDGRVLGLPLVGYTGTEAAIGALTGLEAGMTAFATDTEQWGYYDGAAWQWFGEPGDYLQATDIDTLAELNAIVADATLADESDLVKITRIIGASAPITVTPADGVLDEDLEIGISSATTGAEGAVELATTAEAQTGTDTSRAVTPAGLRADVPATPAASRGVRLDASGDLILPGDVIVPNGGFVGISGADGWTFDSTNGDISTTSNVGINETDPIVELDVAGQIIANTDNPSFPGTATIQAFSDVSSTPCLALFDNRALAADTGGKISFGSKYTTGPANNEYYMGASIRGGRDLAASGQYGTYLAFTVRAQGAAEYESVRFASNGNVGLNETDPDYKLDVDGDANVTGVYRVDDTQVVTNRQTGWGAPTGTATRTAFETDTVTLEDLAERVHALIDDLTTHGLIGA